MQAKAITIAPPKRLKVLLVHHKTMRQASFEHSLGMQYMIYSCEVSPFLLLIIVFLKSFPLCCALWIYLFFWIRCASDPQLHASDCGTAYCNVYVRHSLLYRFPVWENNPSWCALTESHFHVFMLSQWVCLETYSMYRCTSLNHALNSFAQVYVNL